VSALRDARLYLVSRARLAAGDLAGLVDELASAGVDLIQLREKELEAGDLIRAGEPLAAACHAAGINFIVNDRPDVALALDADGVHLGQNDLPVGVARRILGTGIVGRSTHTETEIDGVRAAPEPIDYIAVGPVFETPTKAGRPAAGRGLVAYAARRAPVPWFAIGGLNASNLEEVIVAGARRIVVVRAIAEAKDPVAAAAGLRAMLDVAPLD
jgi:thiamine-phosphate pyrophosphorylase